MNTRDKPGVTCQGIAIDESHVFEIWSQNPIFSDTEP